VTRRTRKKIGEVLTESGLVSKEQLEEALEESRKTGVRLGQVLVNRRLISESDLIRSLSDQLDIPWMSLAGSPPDGELVSLIPEGLARRYKVVPHSMDGNSLVVVMADPLNVFATDALKKVVRHPLQRIIAPESEIDEWVGKLYGVQSPLSGVLADTAAQTVEVMVVEESPDRLIRMAEETPVVRLVNAILSQALSQRSSDIHIEPGEKGVGVRLRVDGVLEAAAEVPAHLKLALISRIKIISGMDIAEKRVPQDGRFRWSEQGRDVDVRASTLPIVHGEKVVLRILDKSISLLDLHKMGFSEEIVRHVREIIGRPYGIILATGPTGSGKTTTLYAGLREINAVGRNIVTVEDPVEYEIDGLNQVQIVPQIGLDFSTVLRNILRQDPDVIMVGEIRDEETAHIAVHAALTGHLVFSTLHTNDAIGAIPRMLDMGVEPYLIRASLSGVLGQRLVRVLCQECKEISTVPPEILETLGDQWRDQAFYAPAGCSRCRKTGYVGRTGIAEMLVLTRGIRNLVVGDPGRDEILAKAREQGYKTMREEGIRRAAEGTTSLEEVLRVTQDIDL